MTTIQHPPSPAIPEDHERDALPPYAAPKGLSRSISRVLLRPLPARERSSVRVFLSIFAPRNRSVNAQARDAAVRVDVETNVRDRPTLFKLFFVEVACVRLQFRLRQNLFPRQRWDSSFVNHFAFGIAGFERTGVRVVSFEMRRVSFDTRDLALSAELNHSPI